MTKSASLAHEQLVSLPLNDGAGVCREAFTPPEKRKSVTSLYMSVTSLLFILMINNMRTTMNISYYNIEK
jgi:hypothetical protein